MKKKFLAIALCLMTTVSLFGCGKDNNVNTENTESTEKVSLVETTKRSGEFDIKAADQVKNLADYKEIAVTLTQDYSVTDEIVNSQIESVLKRFNLLYVEVTDRTEVQAGDFVEIMYVGYNDKDEAFEGGTSQSPVVMNIDENFDETSGSSYIPGFCDHLPGAKVGETVASPVTFPENYGNADLAGKDCRFDITVNKIYKKISFEEVEDDAIASNLSTYEIHNKQELKEFITKNVNDISESKRYSEIVDLCEKNLLENSEVEVPEEYLSARVNEYVNQFAEENLPEGMTLEDYVASYGQNIEDVKAGWAESIKDQVKLEFIFLVIAEKEGITLDEEAYAEFIDSYIQNESTGFSSAEDLYKKFGSGNVEEGEAYAKNLYLIRQAIKFVGDSAKVTDLK